jgi:GDP-L-fucose synthase
MQHTDTLLITGASGMIGSALVRLLQQEGFSTLLTPTHSELELRDAASVRAYFTAHKPAYVFHLAARVGGIHANNVYPAEFVYDNTAMQLNVFEAARTSGVQKILFPGSACTYPKLAPQPVKEEEFLNGKIEPTNIAYAAAKINGIVMAQSYAKQYGMRVVVPMPTNTYGVGDNFSPESSHVIPALMQRFHTAKTHKAEEVILWGSGKPMREFMYVDDAANALIFLMKMRETADIINVGTGEEISIGDLAQKIAEAVGFEGRIALDVTKPDGAPRKILDSTPLFALGWRPKVSLSEGLRRMYFHHFLKGTPT